MRLPILGERLLDKDCATLHYIPQFIQRLDFKVKSVREKEYVEKNEAAPPQDQSG